MTFNEERPTDEPGAAPFISFLTTVYRTENYLPSMIESVLAQTSPDWELVIVDNGRSDAVVDVVDAYAHDPRIRMIRQENQGYRGGVSAAAQAARGCYLSVLDSDDRVMPDFVAVMAELVQEFPDVGAIGCDAVQFDEGEQVQLRSSYLDSVGVRWQARYARQKLTLGDALSGVIPYYTGAVRRQAWQQVGGYADADDDVDESVVIWLRLVQQFDVRLIDARLGWYRIRQGSLSREPATVEAFEHALLTAFSRAATSATSAADRTAVNVTISRLRFHQQLRRARWALLDGDTSAARSHARQAFAVRPCLRSGLVVAALAVSPPALRRMHPYKQKVAGMWRRVRSRLRSVEEHG